MASKSLNFLLTGMLCLASVISSPTFANERRDNWNLREKIQSRVAEECQRALGNMGEGTRGLTRGATRGIRSSLPTEVERVNNLFADVIRAELDLPYGSPHDPVSFEFLKQDPHESEPKIKIWNEFGYQWDSASAPSHSPKWMEFAANYRNALEKRGIDSASTFVPALVLYRNKGPSQKTGKMLREYLFIDPLTESFPENMSEWKVLTKDVEFNLPFDPIFRAMQDGKFPLLDAVHDVSHFVAFTRFPEFGKTVRSQMQQATKDTTSRGFKRREYWLTEALSVLDPESKAANHQFLKSQGRSLRKRNLSTIETDLSALSEEELINYAYQSAKHFESQLRDVSGGNSSPAEKWFYLSESFGMKAQDLLNEDISRVNPVPAIAGLSKTYFENGPITLNANPKAMTNETATFSFSTFVASQKLLALSLRGGRPLEGMSREEALRALVQFTSRTEALLVQKPFSYEEWARSFLQKDLPHADPVAQTLQRTFGSDIIRDLYLGEGDPR